MMAIVSGFGDVPKDAYPIDYAMFASMYAFAQVFGTPDIISKINSLEGKLREYHERTAVGKGKANF
jgi:hypothetical protein